MEWDGVATTLPNIIMKWDGVATTTPNIMECDGVATTTPILLWSVMEWQPPHLNFIMVATCFVIILKLNDSFKFYMYKGPHRTAN